MTQPRFANLHMVVTGAGTGIGRAIARRLASEGARVSLLGRRSGPLQETAAAITGPVHIETCDIRSRVDVDRAFAAAASALGPVHALIANAGIGGGNQAGPADRFDDIVATNLTGTYSCLRAFERHAAPGPDTRHVVVVASILARIGVSGYTGYCSSKAGLLGLVRAASMELAPANVQVNAICPGWVKTDMAWQGIDAIGNAMGATRDQALAEVMKPVPLGRMSEPTDVAGLVAYLVSPDARGITGQSLDMNNGAWM